MKQVTVLAENRPGELARITTSLAEAGVNIEAIDAEGRVGEGLIILGVDRVDDALRALTDAGFQAVTQDVLLFSLPDRPGALARIAIKLGRENIDVRSLHILRREGGVSLVSLVCSDHARAEALLSDPE